MTDESIAERIERLVAEEHELRSREQADRENIEELAAERERLSAVEGELDRCWDLLRQRRALRGAGRSARLGPPSPQHALGARVRHTTRGAADPRAAGAARTPRHLLRARSD